MDKESMRGSLNPKNAIQCIRYRILEMRLHPLWFRVFGTCIFCGAQGYGKTLSAVYYVLNLCNRYPLAILVSNVAIKSRPFNTRVVRDGDEYKLWCFTKQCYVDTEYIKAHYQDEDFEGITIEYSGLNDLKYVNNREYGVIFLIDELHLELNSLESKNVDIEIMVEISQQRKQRKHIVGTSQIFLRLAKPLREQIHDIILCKCIMNVLQYNKWIDGQTVVEKNGHFDCKVVGRSLWWHAPWLYQEYDTYTKMRRYNKEWKGRKRIDIYRRIDDEFTE